MFSLQSVLLVSSQRIVGNFTAVQYTVYNILLVHNEALKNSSSITTVINNHSEYFQIQE